MAVSLDISEVAPEFRSIARKMEVLDDDMRDTVTAGVERAIGRAAVDPIRAEYDVVIQQEPVALARPRVRTGETRRRIGAWTRTRRGKRNIRVGGRNFGAVAVTLGITRQGKVLPPRPFVERGVENSIPKLTAAAVKEAQNRVDRALAKLRARGQGGRS